ncbi:MAG: DUF1992 domain-containing protein [Actinobacteria bacterium]|nr:DUF1992 domain-containing protein [Actinomycetota bacterium]
MPTEGGIPIPLSLVERQIREAMERGEFENLPGAGRPIEGIDAPYDPAWWAKEWLRRNRLADEARELKVRAAAEDLRLRAAGKADEADRLLDEANRHLGRINRMLAPIDRVDPIPRPAG